VEWKTPEFEEIETRAEVTAYAGHWDLEDWD
jgi:coenzyme PQQ precursor peptide PqqA